MKRKTVIILAAVFLTFLLNVLVVSAAPPEISDFTIEPAFPDLIQFKWDVNDPSGLTRVEIYKDTKLIYHEDISGTHNINTYQIPDDNQTHSFEFIIYDSVGLSASVKKDKTGDTKPPYVTTAQQVVSNKRQLIFTTNEPSICGVGFTESNLTQTGPLFQMNYSVTLQFKQGYNKVFIKCADREDNTMSGFSVVDYTYDITAPSKVSNITSSGNRITWNAAYDENGIDKYVIYNTLNSIATTYQTYWDVTTGDDMFFISAIDKAGNEGERTEFNMKRAKLIEGNQTPQAAPKVDAAPKSESIATPAIQIDYQKTGIVVLIILAVLLVFYGGLKLYEHRTDPHGLRKYIKHRRKIRDVEIRKRHE